MVVSWASTSSALKRALPEPVEGNKVKIRGYLLYLAYIPPV